MPARFEILSARALDLSDADALQDTIVAEIDRQERVVPLRLAYANYAPSMWLQPHLVPKTDVIMTPELFDEQGRILLALEEGRYSAGAAFEVRLTVDGEVLEYTAYGFGAGGTDAVDLIDPVVLGMPHVPTTIPMHHEIAGESKYDSWIGCEREKRFDMDQGTMNHEASFLFITCSVDGWCDDEAIGVIMCDTQKAGCPRLTGNTIPSGSCDYDRSWTCSGQVNIKSKAAVEADGNCQHNVNVEMMWDDSTIKWKIKYTSPETPVGHFEVEFEGETPSHSVYQIYTLTMCCERPESTTYRTTTSCVPSSDGCTTAATCEAVPDGEPAGAFASAEECEAAALEMTGQPCACDPTTSCGDGVCNWELGESPETCWEDCGEHRDAGPGDGG